MKEGFGILLVSTGPFAAGLGTRLRPVTDTIPKALVTVGGLTILERAIRRLLPLDPGLIVVNAHHHAEQIEAVIEALSRDLAVEAAGSHDPEALEFGFSYNQHPIFHRPSAEKVIVAGGIFSQGMNGTRFGTGTVTEMLGLARRCRVFQASVSVQNQTLRSRAR